MKNEILQSAGRIAPDPATSAPTRRGFTSSEHAAIGDIAGNVDDSPLTDDIFIEQARRSAQTISIITARNATLTFGQIVALAGDFMGVPGYPIANGKNLKEKREYFVGAFKALFTKSTPSYLQKILALFDEETRLMKEASNAGKTYGEAADEVELKMGGKYAEAAGRIYYGALLNYNYDHFGGHAVNAYKIAHQFAIEVAKQTGNMNMAYAFEAFAAHYFTDAFSSGHFRTPRKELSAQVRLPILGSWLSHYQHNEDGEQGLWVTNDNGDSLQLFGDGRLGDSQENSLLVYRALRISIKEVEFAGINPVDPTLKNSSDADSIIKKVSHILNGILTLPTYEAEKYLPKEDSSHCNFPALFRLNMKGEVEVRKPVRIDYSKEYNQADIDSGIYHTANWWARDVWQECYEFFELHRTNAEAPPPASRMSAAALASSS